MDVASLQDIVDLLPLPVLSKLKQKVDAILYHLSMDQVGKAANENALQDDDDFDVHLLGDIFSNNSMDNFEKIINLLPAQVAARCCCLFCAAYSPNFIRPRRTTADCLVASGMLAGAG